MTECPPGVHSMFDCCPGDCDAPFLAEEITDLAVDTLAEWIKGYTFPDDGSNQLRIQPTELVAGGLTVRVEELDPFPTYVGSFRIRLTVEEIT